MNDEQRYKKALEEIQEHYPPSVDAHKMAHAALNPPPVTLTDLQLALYKAEGRTGDYVALLINKDGSGNFRLGPSERLGKDFNNLRVALAMLLSDTNLSL